jgi:hypothetical protein
VLRLAWAEGTRLSAERVAAWQHERFALDAPVVTTTLRDLLARHDATLALRDDPPPTPVADEVEGGAERASKPLPEKRTEVAQAVEINLS